jgi:hypothetical protein
MVSRAAREGLALTVRQVFEHQTLGALAQVAGHSAQVLAEQGLVRGEATLTPILHWFFDQAAMERHHFNQSVLLEVSAELSAERLEAALRRLAWQHDALRLRFHAMAGGWRAGTRQVRRRASRRGSTASAESEAVVAERQSSLTNPPAGAGGAAAVAARRTAAGDPPRWWTGCGGFCWRIRPICWVAEATLPAKTTAFREWSERLAGWAESAVAQEETALVAGGGGASLAVLPRDGPVAAGGGHGEVAGDGDGVAGASNARY